MNLPLLSGTSPATDAFAQAYPRGGVMHLYPSLMSLRDYAAFQELLRPKE